MYVCVCVELVAGVRADTAMQLTGQMLFVSAWSAQIQVQIQKNSYKSSYRYMQALMNTLHIHTYLIFSLLCHSTERCLLLLLFLYPASIESGPKGGMLTMCEYM